METQNQSQPEVYETAILKLSDIIKSQAIYNVGTAGHVMHGKSTLVAQISGTRTQRHKDEKERNITINLGYASFKIYIGQSGKLYAAPSDSSEPKDCAEPTRLLYHVSFVDCPGHKAYMATMVSGSTIMDSALVLVAANEKIPQPQTTDHIVALNYSNVTDIVFLLNKLDLLKRSDALKARDTLGQYLSGQGLTNPPIIPISAATGVGLDTVLEQISNRVASKIPRLIADARENLQMYIVRSYNINRPNAKLADLEGAVIGGTIIRGTISVGDQVEIRPGVLVTRDGKRAIQPLISRVCSIKNDRNNIDVAVPGGLVGVNLSLYAGLSNSDRLKGQVVGHHGHMPDIYDSIGGTYSLLPQYLDLDLNTLQGLTVVVNGIANVATKGFVCKNKKRGAGAGAGESEAAGAGKGKFATGLETPIVLDKNNSKVALMYNGSLIAALRVKDGECSMEVIYPDPNLDQDWKPRQYTIINDLEQYKPVNRDMDSLITEFPYRTSLTRNVRLTAPALNIVNGSTMISNRDVQTLITELSFPEAVSIENKLPIIDLLTSNLDKEFTTAHPRLNSDGSLVMDGRIKITAITNFLANFQRKLLQCPSCHCNKSTLSKSKGMTLRTCHNCPSITYLQSIKMNEIA